LPTSPRLLQSLTTTGRLETALLDLLEELEDLLEELEDRLKDLLLNELDELTELIAIEDEARLDSELDTGDELAIELEGLAIEDGPVETELAFAWVDELAAAVSLSPEAPQPAKYRERIINNNLPNFIANPLRANFI